MHIANVTNFDKDFLTIQALYKKKKIYFIGDSRKTHLRGHDFFFGYCAHRLMVRENVKDDDIIGYAEFKHFPKIEALPADSWTYWLNLFCFTDNLTPGNVMFLTFCIYNPAYNPQLLVNIAKEIFYRENGKDYILVVELPEQKWEENVPNENYPNYEFLKGFATVVYPRVFSIANCKNTQRIHVIKRDNIIEQMHYRKAITGDNDELVEIIHEEHADFREIFGEYYITEEVLRQEEDEHQRNLFIVTEVYHKTMGFIWLNNNLDIEKLIINFELELFGNLVKFSPNKPYFEKIIRTTGVRKKLNLFTEDAIQDKLVLSENVGKYFFLDDSRSSVQSEHSQVLSEGKSHRTCERNSADHYHFREEVLKTIQEIRDILKKPDYYTEEYDKTFFYRYNISRNSNRGYAEVDEVESDDEKADEEEADEKEADEEEAEPALNAFCIQFFGIHSSYDIRRLHRFLATSFAAYSNRDYCLLSVPKSAKKTNSLFEILKYFVSVVPRPNCKIADYLYVTHRSSIFGDLTVASLRSSDIYDIDDILRAGKPRKRRITRFSIGTESKQEFTSEPEMVREIMSEVLKNPSSDYNFLTIRIGDSSKPIDKNVIVGFVILRRFYQLHLLKQHFKIPETGKYLDVLRAEVVFLKLHPFYHAHSDILFREISSHSDIYDFYYFAPNMFSQKPITNDLISKMQPVEPLRRKKMYKYYKTTDADLNAARHLQQLDYVNDTFSVFTMNMRPTRYFTNPNSIIIMGFSNESKAFLRSIIFSFNDIVNKNAHCCVPLVKIIVLVGPGEDEAEYDKDLRCTMCEDQNDCWINYSNWSEYIRDTVERMDFRVYINFINAKVDRIDRERNYVVLKNKCELHYDVLLICASTFFGIPVGDFNTALPHNYAQINNRLDKLMMFHKIKYIREQNTPFKIIVYGSHIRTFEYINFLLKHGIEANSIQLVLPHELKEREFHYYYNIPYADLNIEAILQEMAEDLGVECHEKMNFKEWKCYSFDNNNISHVIFERFPDGKLLSLECDLFVSYCENHPIEEETIRLLQAANIEMDGRFIIIDDNYRTNDPCIYALGKFMKRSETPNYQYIYVSPFEAAKRLIHQLGLNLVPENIDERFRIPSYFQAQLPMGYYFVKITAPKLYIANHLSNEYGFRLVTYKDNTFCRVRLNEHGIVEEFVCVTQRRMPFDFLQFFVGKHEKLLNDLKRRWLFHEIDNFLDFFQEPWCELLMHRKFSKVHTVIKKLSLETAKDIMENSTEDRNGRKNLMKRYMHDKGATKEVEKVFLNFLRTYRQDFPKDLFALPEDFLPNHRN